MHTFSWSGTTSVVCDSEALRPAGGMPAETHVNGLTKYAERTSKSVPQWPKVTGARIR